MSPGQDKQTKDFFQKNWHHPLRRLGKVCVPIICAFFLSLTIIFSLYYLFSEYMIFLYQPVMESSLIIFKHCLFSVIVGTLLVFSWGILSRHRQAQFRPIRLKITRRSHKNGGRGIQ